MSVGGIIALVCKYAFKNAEENVCPTPQVPIQSVQRDSIAIPTLQDPLGHEETERRQKDQDEVRIYKPEAPKGESGHCCPECHSYLLAKKKSARRLPSCHICHHYMAASCHRGEGGKCLLLPGEATCVDLSTCPSGHVSLHAVRDNQISRDIRNEQTLISKNAGTELSKDPKVASSAALQKFVSMLADTQPERVDTARKRAERWYKTFGTRPRSDDDEFEEGRQDIRRPPSPAREPKKKDEDLDAYDLPEAELLEKIKRAKKAEASLKRKREALEAMLASNKRSRLYESDDD